jgi:hypothetical protein
VAVKMKWKNLFVALVCLCSATFGFAGEQAGTVDTLHVRISDGLIYFTLKGGAITGKPACSSGNYWMIRSETAQAGKMQYAALLAAQMAGKNVRVFGLNTCVRWGDGEDVDGVTTIQ